MDSPQGGTLLDEDDLAAALLLMRSTARDYSARVLYRDENEDPDFPDVAFNESRKRPPLSWVFIKQFEGPECHIETEARLLPRIVGRA